MKDIPPPRYHSLPRPFSSYARYDFYQNPESLTLSIYMKGLNAVGVKEMIEVGTTTDSITIILPAESETASDNPLPRRIIFKPLYSEIKPGGTQTRILSTKIEIKLIKAGPVNWPTLLASSSDSPEMISSSQAATNTVASPSLSGNDQQDHNIASASISLGHIDPATKSNLKPKKNWDKFGDDDEESDSKDPNAGGDAALQKFFAQIYAGADPDTRKAMIKSYTESGGTSLSTNWQDVSKDKVKAQPPEGMYEMKL